MDVGRVRESVPFLHVADMSASLAFYRDGLGFEMPLHWMDEGVLRWCQLKLGGASIMLQAYRPGRVPAETRGVGLSVTFMCEDALAIWRATRSRGLHAIQRPFVGNGLWVVSFVDPDGYRLDFESPTDAAEETEYDGE